MRCGERQEGLKDADNRDLKTRDITKRVRDLHLSLSIDFLSVAAAE